MQRKPLLVISTAALLVALSVPVTFAKKKAPVKAPAVPQLSQDEKILHVLNRLTFGARPGDVERGLHRLPGPDTLEHRVGTVPLSEAVESCANPVPESNRMPPRRHACQKANTL